MFALLLGMNNAMYVSLAQQTNLFRSLDVSANNVANVNTPGFKGETMVFEKYLVDDKDNFTRNKVAYPEDISTFTDYKDGAATPTGRPLDVALEGSGFFKVKTPQGIRYTRRGAFHIDNQGQIVTSEGYAVLDDKAKPILLNTTDIDINISADGTISARTDGQVGSEPDVRGQLKIVHFDSSQKLTKRENGYFSNEGLPELKTPAPARAIQGSLEQSNVNSIAELTNLININRSVTNVTSIMADMHDMIRKAVTAYTQNT